MKIITIDFETYSECDLRKHSAYRYSQHPSTRVMMIGYKIEGRPTVIVKADGYERSVEFPSEFFDYLDEDTYLVAHNTQFERLMMQNVMGVMDKVRSINPRIVCTAALGRHLNMPGALDNLSKFLGLGAKDTPGKDKLKKFSVPQKRKDGTTYQYDLKDHASEWEMVAEYCVQDVELTYKIFLRYQEVWEDVEDLYGMTERLNDRGLGVDMDLASAAIDAAGGARDSLEKEVSELTEGKFSSTNGTRFTAYIHERLPEELKPLLSTPEGKVSFNKERREALQDAPTCPPSLHRLAAIADELSLSSISKYQSMIDREIDGRVQGCYILNGASTTGRFSGVGIQPHNLPRNLPDNPTAVYQDLMVRGKATNSELKSMVRYALQPGEGNTFVGGDFEQIEARVLPWLAKSTEAQKKHDIIAHPELDFYRVTAAKLLGKSYGEVTPEERQGYGKTSELAFGYGGAVGAFQRFSTMDLSEERVAGIVGRWREANAWAPIFWRQLEKAAAVAIENEGRVEAAGRVKFMRKGKMLLCRLPNGRKLHYHDVAIKDGDLSYRSAKQDAYRINLWYGQLAENVTQAVAGELLKEALQTVDKSPGLHYTVGHTHDEILLEAPDFHVEQAVEMLHQAMNTTPEWTAGLRLSAEIWHGKRYGK